MVVMIYLSIIIFFAHYNIYTSMAIESQFFASPLDRDAIKDYNNNISTPIDKCLWHEKETIKIHNILFFSSNDIDAIIGVVESQMPNSSEVRIIIKRKENRYLNTEEKCFTSGNLGSTHLRYNQNIKIEEHNIIIPIQSMRYNHKLHIKYDSKKDDFFLVKNALHVMPSGLYDGYTEVKKYFNYEFPLFNINQDTIEF